MFTGSQDWDVRSHNSVRATLVAAMCALPWKVRNTAFAQHCDQVTACGLTITLIWNVHFHMQGWTFDWYSHQAHHPMHRRCLPVKSVELQPRTKIDRANTQESHSVSHLFTPFTWQRSRNDLFFFVCNNMLWSWWWTYSTKNSSRHPGTFLRFHILLSYLLVWTPSSPSPTLLPPD